MSTPYDQTVRTVLVSGDWHGDHAWAHTVLRKAHLNDARLVVQVGDHAVVWPGRSFTQVLSDHAMELGVCVVLVPGNHDQHPHLDSLPRDENGLAELAPGVWHASRPSRWQVRGVRFAALGGAFSIDFEDRTPGRSWWPEELITPEHVAALGTEPVDVLFTHETPVLDHLHVPWRLPEYLETPCTEQRALVRHAVERTRPKVVFHGHWHQRRDGQVNLPDGGTAVIHALDKEWTSGNWVLLDVDTLKVRDPRKSQTTAL